MMADLAICLASAGISSQSGGHTSDTSAVLPAAPMNLLTNAAHPLVADARTTRSRKTRGRCFSKTSSKYRNRANIDLPFACSNTSHQTVAWLIPRADPDTVPVRSPQSPEKTHGVCAHVLGSFDRASFCGFAWCGRVRDVELSTFVCACVVLPPTPRRSNATQKKRKRLLGAAPAATVLGSPPPAVTSARMYHSSISNGHIRMLRGKGMPKPQLHWQRTPMRATV